MDPATPFKVPVKPFLGSEDMAPSFEDKRGDTPNDVGVPQEKSTIPLLQDLPEELPPARFNPWALPAFALALGTIAYGILGTSNLIIVIAVILTLLVAAIAVKKGRTNEWSGKGFAVAAMTIGALAALITLIALLQGGF